jgi:hypothetical protein
VNHSACNFSFPYVCHLSMFPFRVENYIV